MSNVELLDYLDEWKERLNKNGDYESQKVKQLLDNYHDHVVSDIAVDSVLADIEAGALSCEV